MKELRFRYEDADGDPDQCTGLYIDHGDGTSSWLASGALDAATPLGSPKTWREIGLRAREDAKTLPKFQAKPVEPAAPTAEQIEAAQAVVVP